MNAPRFPVPVLLGLLIACAPAAPPAVTSAPDGGTRAAVIHRDAWGVPHVLAETDEGAVSGMAWALAEDDWRLMEENYLHALGRTAELVGEAGVPDDWMARRLEIVPLSMAEYDDASPRLRGLLDAFAAGLNAWLESRPREELRIVTRVEPWYPLALIRYKYYQNEFLGYAGLRGAWARRELEEALAADGTRLGWAGRTSTSTSTSDTAARATAGERRYFEAQFDDFGLRPRGSNQWALAPSRTASGRAMLLINPHQSFVGVQRYAEIHLDSREGLRFSGLTVFGFLLPYMGNNEALGWAYTDNYADHSDLYAIAFDDADDDADPLRYRYDGGWRPATAWTDSIRVRRDDGTLETRILRHRKTHHGPIVGIDDEGRPLAVRMARYVEGGWYDQWDAMIRARSLEEWRAGVATLRVAYMNTMYADRDGNIGYIYNSAVPRRAPGVDPSGILDGADPRTEWQGFHALDELPQVWNPASGWLLNTNSTPFTATTGLALSRDDFPAYMVGPESDNARAVSSRRVLEAMDGVTLDDFASRVWDSHLSLADDDVLPALAAEWAATSFPADDTDAARLARAVDRLADWDRRADTASVETTWFTLMVERRIAARRAGRLADGAPSWVAALAEALRLLREEWGTDEVAWGRLNRHQRPLPGQPVGLDPERPSLAVGGANGGFGSVFSYYSRPVAGPAGPRIGTGGNSFVKVIEFGPEPRARSVLNYGQSGHPTSPHFFDQAEIYARRGFKEAWWGRTEVEGKAVGPGGGPSDGSHR